MTWLDGYKTYFVSFLVLVGVVAEGLTTGTWNAQLGAIALLASTLRNAIEKIE